MDFSKWQGIGNDFIIVSGFRHSVENPGHIARRLCHRRLGIGADGLVIILPSARADFRMRIFNSDGSEADMCGNATRCVARYVYQYGLTAKRKITLEAMAGIIPAELLIDRNQPAAVRVDLGEPRLNRHEIPVAGDPEAQAVNIPLAVNGQVYPATCVSTGVPHCVVFVDDISAISVSGIGPLLENHSLFPRKTNVEFVQVLSPGRLRMRVWERGPGLTMACGTGAAAALVAAVLNNKAKRQATVILDGGELAIEWAVTNHVFMSGPAEEVFRGSVNID